MPRRLIMSTNCASALGTVSPGLGVERLSVVSHSTLASIGQSSGVLSPAPDCRRTRRLPQRPLLSRAAKLFVAFERGNAGIVELRALQRVLIGAFIAGVAASIGGHHRDVLVVPPRWADRKAASLRDKAGETEETVEQSTKRSTRSPSAALSADCRCQNHRQSLAISGQNIRNHLAFYRDG
jgi:hypothetical protein